MRTSANPLQATSERAHRRTGAAKFRAEVEAWIAAPASDASPYVNLRAMGFATRRDAQAWARANDVPVMLLGGKLLARASDVATAKASPAVARVYYTTSPTSGAEYATRADAAEAVRVAMGWRTVALSADIEMEWVTAHESEQGALWNAESPTAPRIFRRVRFERNGKP